MKKKSNVERIKQRIHHLKLTNKDTLDKLLNILNEYSEYINKNHGRVKCFRNGERITIEISYVFVLRCPVKGDLMDTEHLSLFPRQIDEPVLILWVCPDVRSVTIPLFTQEELIVKSIIE